MANSIEEPLIVVVSAWVVLLTALAGSRIVSRTKLLPDHPNHRSSHARVTSKAGGVVIIGAWLVGMFILNAFSDDAGILKASATLSLLAFSAFLIGLVDDRWEMPSIWKFAGQTAVAAGFTILFAPLYFAPIPFVGLVDLGAAGYFISIFWIIAFMNAFNFMDGSNGLAAGSAAMGLCGLIMIVVFFGSTYLAIIVLFLTVALLGFLPSNMRRGKIFMGDNGSQAISFLIGCFAILSANSPGNISALVVPVIFLPFIFDVTLTLSHRVARGQNVLSAHREHLYQLMILLGVSHTSIAVIYMTLTALSTAGAIFHVNLAPRLAMDGAGYVDHNLRFGRYENFHRCSQRRLVSDEKKRARGDGNAFE